jgi:hypothetical protein
MIMLMGIQITSDPEEDDGLSDDWLDFDSEDDDDNEEVIDFGVDDDMDAM